MFSWIHTKVKEYWTSPPEAMAEEMHPQQDLPEIAAAPWEIGGPQPAFVALAQSQELRSPVLDVGCGTGENTLYLTGFGLDVNGIDSARAAIEAARDKARLRQVRAYFRTVDALDLACLGTTFETVIDSGLFVLFTDEERARFIPSLAAALRPGGTYFMLGFSDQEIRETPGRISEAEIRSLFQTGWTINYIRPATIETKIHDGGAKAWLASITRTRSDEKQGA